MRHEAIYATHPKVTKIADAIGAFDADGNQVEIDESKVTTKIAELQATYDAQAYARNREKEYPTIQELVVALYDPDDKTAVDTKRAAIKAKYPKPE